MNPNCVVLQSKYDYSQFLGETENGNMQLGEVNKAKLYPLGNPSLTQHFLAQKYDCVLVEAYSPEIPEGENNGN